MMSCIIKLPGYSSELAASFAYGSNFEQERKVLWEEIVAATDRPLLKNMLWSILGDFNQILYSSEHSSAGQFVFIRPIREF